MKSTIACAAFGAAMLSLTATAFAADNTGMQSATSSAMMATTPSAMMATMMCRPAQTGEKATAMMGTSALVCKNIDMDKMTAMNKQLMAMPGGEAMVVQMIQDDTIQKQGSF